MWHITAQSCEFFEEGNYTEVEKNIEEEVEKKIARWNVTHHIIIYIREVFEEDNYTTFLHRSKKEHWYLRVSD